MTARRLAALVVVAALGAACADAEDAGGPTTERPTTEPVETGSVQLGPADRPARLVAPDDVTAPAPLLVLLHGYRSNAGAQDGYLGVTAQAASRGLYVLLPNGTIGPNGNRFWDAAPACCNFSGTPVDDVGYLSELIDEALAERPIDPERVYVLGHSNGGFMAYRLACERADLVVAVAALAGTEQPHEDWCDPSRPVSVLHLHGTDDEIILYDGGTTEAPYVGAVETADRWAARNGCDPASTEGDRLDLVADLDGNETVPRRFEGCADGVAVQLDTMEGARHVPALEHERVGTDVLDWLLQHAR